MLKFSGLADLSSCFKEGTTDRLSKSLFPEVAPAKGPQGTLCDLIMPTRERYALHVPGARAA